MEEVTKLSASEIEDQSPDGLPAHPEAGPRTITLWLATIIVAILSIALVFAIVGFVDIAIGVGAVGLLFFIANPAVWASTLRAGERNKLSKERVGNR